MKRYSLIVLVAALMLVGCTKRVNPTMGSFIPTETKFMNNIGDGSIVVRAWGFGATTEDARNQAQKQALRDIIFKGVNVNGNAMLSKPLVTELNAEQKYQAFFNAFFAENGDWTRFVSAQDDLTKKRNKRTDETWQKTESATVRVHVAELQGYLMDKGILKP